MTLQWACYRTLRWDWFRDTECGAEFTTDVEPEEWADGTCTAFCHKCNAELNQQDDNPEILDRHV